MNVWVWYNILENVVVINIIGKRFGFGIDILVETSQKII